MTPLAFILLANLPPISTDVVQTIDLGKLTYAGALNLDGRQVRVSFIVNSLPQDFDDETLYNAAGLPGVARGVRFRPGIFAGEYKIGQRVEAEGKLRVWIVPPGIVRGQFVTLRRNVTVMEARAAR